MSNVRVRLLGAMGVLLMGLLVLATQCPNSSSSLVAVLNASPTSGTSPLTVNFDASSSLGPDSTMLAYDWAFGDGDTGTGETIYHTYRQPGVYTALVTVTDDDGNMDSTSCEITVTAAVGTPPSAGFTASPSSGKVPLTVNFNASASFDPDGSIISYAWSFDDGGSGSGVIVTHTYTSAGTYYPLLCVTDDNSNQDYAAQTVRVLSSPVANNPPTASFTASPTSGQAPLAVSFNASGSSDSDGSITSYAWSFGDGGSSSGVTASHTYTSAGTYTTQLTVTDDDGSTDSATRIIQVSAAPSVPEDLYVAANSGSDTIGDGEQGNPYKTLSKAVGVANDGAGATHTIHLAAGIYDASLGEEFPLLLDRVNLLGEAASADQVKVVGQLTARSCFIRELSLYRPLIIDGGGAFELDSCRLLGMGSTVAVTLRESQGGVSIHDCYFEDNLYAIEVRGENLVTIVNNNFLDNAYAIVAYVSGDIRISSNTIENLSGAFTGIYIASTSIPGVVTVRDTMIVVRGDPIVLKATNTGSQFLMEDCALTGYRAIFIQGSESFAMDLGGGTQGSRGGNSITATRWGIYDYRPSFSGTIYAKNNTWNDPQPSGTVSGPVDNSPNYFIENEGNSIVFSN